MLRKLETYLENKILTLPSWLSAHLKRTADVAVELANNHEVDPIRCRLSALAHDIAKTYDNIDWHGTDGVDTDAMTGSFPTSIGEKIIKMGLYKQSKSPQLLPYAKQQHQSSSGFIFRNAT